MFKFIMLLLLAVNLSIAYAAGDANNDATKKEQVIKFVNQAADYIEQNGKIKAIAAFADKNGGFQKGNLYIFAFVCGVPGSDGFILADAAAPEMLFENQLAQKQVKAVYDAAMQHPNGAWVQFQWLDLNIGKVTIKHAYVRYLKKYNLCIGSGYYTATSDNN